MVNPGTGRRRARRTYVSHAVTEPRHEWAVSPSVVAPRPPVNHFLNVSGPSPSFQSRRPSMHIQEFTVPQANEAPVQLHMPYSSQQSPFVLAPPSQYVAGPSRLSQPSPPSNARHRYSPYESPIHAPPVPAAHPAAQSDFDEGQNIRLAPIRELDDSRNERRNSAVKLPPISTLDGFRQGSCGDSAAVLRRLQTPDDQCTHPELSPHSRDTAHQHTLGLPPSRSYYP